MPSNREAYFEALDLGIPKEIAIFALQEIDGFNYTELTNHFDDEIKNYNLFIDSINRYKNGEMIEYIFNKAYFSCQPFYVDKNVLIPRQETEELVLRVKEIIEEEYNNRTLDFADVCTGSGVIGICVRKHFLDTNISINAYLTDISKEAIRVAKKNAYGHGLNDITFLEGDMLEPLILRCIKLDVLVCNPPYIENENTIDEKTWKQEPHLALLAKPCTFFYEKIFKNLSLVMKDKYLLAFEIGEDMEKPLTDLINKYCPNDSFCFKQDMYGKTRFLFIKHQ